MPPTNSVYYESNKLVLSVLIPESPGRCLVSSRLLSNISTCLESSHSGVRVRPWQLRTDIGDPEPNPLILVPPPQWHLVYCWGRWWCYCCDGGPPQYDVTGTANVGSKWLLLLTGPGLHRTNAANVQIKLWKKLQIVWYFGGYEVILEEYIWLISQSFSDFEYFFVTLT